MKWRSLQESGSYSDMRPLREIFAERKEAIAKYVPADVQAVHDRAVAELKAQGLAARALKIGDQSPSFELPDHNGKLVSSVGSASQRKARAVVHPRALVSILRRADGGHELHSLRRSQAAGASLRRPFLRKPRSRPSSCTTSTS